MFDFQDLLNKAGNKVTKLHGYALAAQEAVPALFGGLIGQNRTDTSVAKPMQQGLIDAYSRAKARGSDSIQYEDYDMSTPGGIGAKLTFGRVGPGNLKFDKSGNVVGIQNERYDTDKTPMQALGESEERFKSGDISGGIYKPFEALLAAVQGRGLTTHNVDFDAKPAQAAPVPTAPTAPAAPQSYTVKRGDTLGTIANQLGVSVEELARRNKISNPNLIQVGQQIR